MRCPKCGKDVELLNKQVGVDENGKPIFNKYAICKDCKKQWNLDKQKEKKAANVNASNHTQVKENNSAKPANVSGTRPVPSTPSRNADKKDLVNKETSESKVRKPMPRPTGDAAGQKTVAKTYKKSAPDPSSDKQSRKTVSGTTDASVPKHAPAKASPGNRPAATVKRTNSPNAGKNPAAPAGPAAKTNSAGPVPKKRTNPADAAAHKQDNAGRRYGNIPPEKVREKRENAVKNSYEDMLAADPDRKPVKKKRLDSDRQAVPKKAAAPAGGSPKKKTTPAKSVKRPPVKREEPKPKFYMPRIVLGIVSIAAFAFFAYKGFLAGLSNITAGTQSTTGTVYIVLALCMLVSGLLLIIMRKKHTIFAYILPIIFYMGGAVFAFLKRADDSFLLYGAIASAVLAVVFIVLAIASISGSGDNEDDYDDPFEDDYDNY